MPRRLLLALLSCALLVPTLCPAADLAAPVPLDPAVTTGTLPNGLRYFVRQNAKPEQRAALWLVVGAGSVDEDDDQQGLAHLIEHMAFNGTENFPKQALVSYLESIGMQFGPEVNAYTSQLMHDQQASTLGYVLQNDASVRFTTNSGHLLENFTVRGLELPA